MSDWDFLWGLSGKELDDAMSSGGTKDDWAYISEQERKRNRKLYIKTKSLVSSSFNQKAKNLVK